MGANAQAKIERSRSLPRTLFRLRAVIAAVLLTKRSPEELPAA
jgi:hypothetical protein